MVAASSQAAALRAWNVHQNLFASGEARVTTDGAAVAAAMAHPETPLRRAVGSNAAFELEPTSLPKVPDAPKRSARPAAKGARPAAPQPLADRSGLDAAEAALRETDERRKQVETGFRREAEALDMRRRDAQQAYIKARQAAATAIVKAREAYRKAGGRD